MVIFRISTSALSRRLLSIFIFLVAPLPFLLSAGVGSNNFNATANNRIFLPIVIKTNNTAMLGIYPQNWWVPMPQDGINKYLKPLDAWSGKKLSIAGVFHFLDQPNVVNMMLTPIWDNGYTPFVNLYANTSAANIANGGWDQTIHAWAKNFAIFAEGGRRMAFLAPLQEMNWKGTPYSRDPASFIAAYKRIQLIFAEEKVPVQSVRWVFAPNGGSAEGDPPFESYYPGDALVDVVAFSSYNFGTQPSNPYPKWSPPKDIYPQYIERLRLMAPSKPIFISQTGTTSYGGSKDQWLRDAYALFTNYSQVKAIIYYNADISGYLWAFYLPSEGVVFNGYKDGVSNSHYLYVSPGEISKFIPRTSTP